MTERGTDWSNYQVVPTEDAVASLKGAGVGDFAIVGLQDPEHAARQAEALRAGGVPVEDCYLENTREPQLFGGLLRGWVAVEEHSGYEDEDAIDAAIQYLEDHGLAVGIYSRSTYIGDSPLRDHFAEGGKYASLPRWFARYDGDPEGPHDGATMAQYESGAQLPGIRYAINLDARGWDDQSSAGTSIDGSAVTTEAPAEGTQQQGNANARQGEASAEPTAEERERIIDLLREGLGSIRCEPDDAANPEQVSYRVLFVRGDFGALRNQA